MILFIVSAASVVGVLLKQDDIHHPNHHHHNHGNHHNHGSHNNHGRHPLKQREMVRWFATHGLEESQPGMERGITDHATYPAVHITDEVFDGNIRREGKMRMGGSLDIMAPAALVHIPKCAGTSAKKEINAILPRFYNRYCEFCFRYEQSKIPQTKIWLSMFRSPRSHVVSQHLECKYDKWGKSATRGTGFPRRGTIVSDLEAWVQHFSGGKAVPDFHCYNPWNMQARALTCPGHNAHHSYRSPPDLEEAESRLDQFALVGLVEFYHESLCLLRYKVHDRLEPACECGGPAPHHKHESHDVPNHDNLELSDSLVAMIDEMTAVDRALYAKAVDRFLSDIHQVESETGKQVICEAKMDEFRQKTAYLREAEVSLGGNSPLGMLYMKKTASGQDASTEIVHGILDVPISGLSMEPPF
jgi:hypothetical protein